MSTIVFMVNSVGHTINEETDTKKDRRVLMWMHTILQPTTYITWEGYIIGLYNNPIG